jgi:hypothetical protein
MTFAVGSFLQGRSVDMETRRREPKDSLRPARFDQLIASGLINPPEELGDPLEDCPEIGLPPGTGAALIDSDRDEA